MSEKYKPQNEANIHQYDALNNNHEKAKNNHERGEKHIVRHEHQDHIDTIISKIENTAKTSSELAQHSQKNEKSKIENNSNNVGSQLQSQALAQSLKKIQKSLPKYQRPFSKFIHTKSVENVSKVVGSTVARPSGLLAAGIVSFCISIATLAACRYFGYEYNYLIGSASIGVGFMLGLLFELLLKLKSHKSN